MRKACRLSFALALFVLPVAPAVLADSAEGPPPIQSMSALAFTPDGLLLVGDGKAGAVLALDVGDGGAATPEGEYDLGDVETKIAALLGTRPSEILIHDLAVHPVSHAVYLAVSRGRAKWESRWQLPNDLADAHILLRIGAGGEIGEVDLGSARWWRAELPDPVDPDKTHRWKTGTSLRADAVTQVAYSDGVVWVAGLSNEEFASTLWRVPFPFSTAAAETPGRTPTKTTVEIFHGAHGAWETHAPIRSFVPFALGGKDHLLAAYLCTPLATFETAALARGGHVRGRTVAEFGSGNYPVDMLVYRKDGKQKLLIANTALPLMIVDPADIESFDGAITSEVAGYTAGVPYEIRSSFGIQQIGLLDDERIVALQRSPRGTLDLVTFPVARF